MDCKGRTEGFGEKHKRLGYRESHTNEFYELGVRKRLIWRKSDRMRFKRCGEVRDEGFEESACAIHAGKQCPDLLETRLSHRAAVPQTLSTPRHGMLHHTS